MRHTTVVLSAERIAELHKKQPTEIARELKYVDNIGCNCDLDNWQLVLQLVQDL